MTLATPERASRNMAVWGFGYRKTIERGADHSDPDTGRLRGYRAAARPGPASDPDARAARCSEQPARAAGVAADSDGWRDAAPRGGVVTAQRCASSGIRVVERGVIRDGTDPCPEMDRRLTHGVIRCMLCQNPGAVPRALDRRRSISALTPATPLSTRESAARVTPRRLAASVTLISASHSRSTSPGCGAMMHLSHGGLLSDSHGNRQGQHPCPRRRM